MVQTLARLWAEDDLGWYGSLRAQARGELALPSGPPETAGDGSRTVVPSGSWRRVWEASRPLPSTSKHYRVWQRGN
jgi:hypothetical protein